MSIKKAPTISSLLSAHLTSDKARTAVSVPAPRRTVAAQAAGDGKKSPKKPSGSGAATGGSEKLNLSVYPRDREQIIKIKGFLLKNGVEANASEVVRIALRSAVCSPDMLASHKEIQCEDGRRRIQIRIKKN
jgi:hypothetical protein